jgi:outer membrane protein assembly factor BamD (BamD/ComL family)
MSALLPFVLCCAAGCTSFGGFTPPWKKADLKTEIPAESIGYDGNDVFRQAIPVELRRELDSAKYVFDAQKYAEAEVLYHKLALVESHWWELSLFTSEPEDYPSSSVEKGKKKDEKNKRRKVPNPVREEALFYEAECQRLQKNYRTAHETYIKLLVDHPRTQYTQQACRGLFEIADYWLEPTRRQMDQYQEQLQGKRWMVTPALYVHFEKEMPLLDAEGSALAILNHIRLHDIRGKMGEKALLYLGTINFFRHDYKEADFFFTQLREEYPNSEYTPKAIKQSVICKQLCTGGSVYDLRTVEESKKLLMTTQGAYEELRKDQNWIETQLKSITIQQADRDWNIAEFYRRTGHPGAAYFYYELVRRRYPGTSYADQAGQKMNDIRGKVEREQARSQQTGPGPQQAEQQTPAQPALIPPSPQMLPPEISSPRR